MKPFRWLLAAPMMLLLSACGGGGGASSPSPSASPSFLAVGTHQLGLSLSTTGTPLPVSGMTLIVTLPATCMSGL